MLIRKRSLGRNDLAQVVSHQASRRIRQPRTDQWLPAGFVPLQAPAVDLFEVEAPIKAKPKCRNLIVLQKLISSAP
jgi:hypothetical protein